MKKLAITLAAFLLIAPAGAFAARTQSSWLYDSSGYIFPTQNPVNVLISGTSLYLNFGTFSGTSGYGFRDSGGIMQFKNSGGSWAAFGSGSGGSSDPFTHLTNYNTSVSATSTPVWFQGGLMASSTSYFADLQTPSLSNLTTNGFVKTSGGNGTLSIDTTSYLSGTVAIGNGGTNNSAAIGASSTAVLSDGSKYVYYKLAPANFTTANVSQWTNDAGYITSAATAPIATSSIPTVGNVAYWTGNGYPSTLGSAATSSETCTSPLSCGAHVVLSGGGAITLGTVTIAKGGTGLTAVGASSTVLITDGSAAFWQKLATSQLTNDSGFVTSSGVTSVATNNGLTGGTITTTGTLGFDLTKLPVNNLILTYNGSQLQATGTKDNLTVQGITATSTTATSTFANGILINGGTVGIASTTPGNASAFGVTGHGMFSGTVYANNFYDTSISGTTCVGESGGLINTSNCVSSVASSGGTITVSSPTGAVNIDFNLSHSNAWSALQTFTNSTSTLITASTALWVPNATAPVTGTTGQVAINTTAASTSLRYNDGTATRALFPVQDRRFTISTTTFASYLGQGATSTISLGPVLHAETWTEAGCFASTTGTGGLVFEHAGLLDTEYVPVSSTVSDIALATNNVWTKGEKVYLKIRAETTLTSDIACTVSIRRDAD